jgi:hypothetical protein
MAEPPAVQWGTPEARWILLATVLGSGIAFLDTTVVNVALATIGTELGASVAVLQWIVNAYTLTLAALILIGGSLGDRFGRRPRAGRGRLVGPVRHRRGHRTVLRRMARGRRVVAADLLHQRPARCGRHPRRTPPCP